MPTMRPAKWIQRLWLFLQECYQDQHASLGIAHQLFQKQLAQQYRYSWLGFFWAFLPSTLTALVLMSGQRAMTQIDGLIVPSAFYGVFGISMAQTFIDGVNTSRSLFIRNQQLFRRYKISLDGFIMAAFFEVIFNTLIRLMVVIIVFLIFRVAPASTTFPLSVIGFLAVAFQGTGLGLLCAPLNSLKSDFDNIFAVAPWIVFGLTPVFMPFNNHSSLGMISQMIPLARLFESTRAAAYGGSADPWGVLNGLVGGILLITLGWIFCRLARPYVIERIL